MEKNLKELLKNALQKFPTIEKETVGIKYDPETYYAHLYRNIFIGLFGDPTKATIEIGQNFLRLDYATQIAILIHELGHFKKGFDFLAEEGANYLKKNILKRIISNLTPKQRQKSRLALEAYIQDEICADNEILRAGYGQPFLELAKKVYTTYKKKRYKNILKGRILNLEKALGTI